MPDIPTFDDQKPDIHAVGAPEASPAAMGAAGGAVAEAGARLGQVAEEFNRKYWEARNTTDASNAMTGYTTRAGDSEFKWAHTNDRAKALVGYDQDAQGILADVDKDPTLNMTSRAIVKHEISTELNSRRITVSDQSFGREGSEAIAQGEANLLSLATQREQAIQNGNVVLAKQLYDRANGLMKSWGVNGYMLPAEVELHQKQWNSEASMDDIRASGLEMAAHHNLKGLGDLMTKVDNRANFPDLLENERNTLYWRLSTEYNKVHQEDYEAQQRAAAAARREITDKLRLMASGQDFGGMPSEALVNAAGFDDPKAVLDTLKGGAAQSAVRQATALMPLDQKIAQLRDWDKNGVYHAPPGADARMQLIYQKYGKQAHDALLKDVIETQAALVNDGAGYVVQHSPQALALYQAGTKDPAKMRDYFAYVDKVQADLGVPGYARTLLPKGNIEGMAADWIRNPEQLPARLKDLETKWGADNARRIVQEMIHSGKMPGAIQTITMIDDDRMGAILGDYLRGKRPDPVTGKIKIESDQIPADVTKGIQDTIRSDPDLRNYERSMYGAKGGPQVESIIQGVEALAYALYLHNGDDQAAQHAVQAFVGDNQFIPTAGGVVYAPSDKIDVTQANAQDVVNKLDPKNISLPDPRAFGGKKEAYIMDVQNNHGWQQSPNGKWWFLMDGGGRTVKNGQGKPIGVPVGGVPGWKNPDEEGHGADINAPGPGMGIVTGME